MAAWQPKVLKDASVLPKYKGLLSGVDNDAEYPIKLTKDTIDDLVVLNTKSKKICILGSHDLFEKNSDFIISVFLRLKQQGYVLDEEVVDDNGKKQTLLFQTDASIIHDIYQNRLVTGERDLLSDSDAKKKFVELVALADAKKSSEIHIRLVQNNPAVLLRINRKVYPLSGRLDLTNFNALLSMIRAYYNTEYDDGSREKEDFSEKHVQRAKFLVHLPDKDVEIRFQSTPKVSGQGTPYGAKVNLRLLASSLGKFKSLLDLGMEDTQVNLLRAASHRDKGMTFFSGNTGSGKTTGIHVLINSILDYDPNIIIHSIEDPVEIVNEKIEQMPLIVRPDEDEEQARIRAVVALLRQDLDILFYGEVRSAESARVCLEASRTGHGIVGTIHTTGAIATIHRLHYLGIDYFSLGARDSINAIVHQDLFPKLCNECKVEMKDADLEDKIILDGLKLINKGELPPVFKANRAGCSKCLEGYSGVSLIAEVFIPDDYSRELISQGKIDELEHYWRYEQTFSPHLMGEYKGVTFVDHALVKIKRGEISPIDLMKTTGDFTLLKEAQNKEDIAS